MRVKELNSTKLFLEHKLHARGAIELFESDYLAPYNCKIMMNSLGTQDTKAKKGYTAVLKLCEEWTRTVQWEKSIENCHPFIELLRINVILIKQIWCHSFATFTKI